MKNYQHIIWDWNGTLLNDVDLCVRIMNDIMQNHPEDLPSMNHQHYRNIFDFPVIEYYQRIGFDFNKESFDDLCVKFIGAYHSSAVDLKLHSKAKEVLLTVETAGFHQSILSAAKQEGLQQMVKHHEINHHFEHIMGESDDYAHGKVANAQLLRQQLQKLNHDRLLLIGDTTHDFEVAEAIEADCILVAHGHHSHQKLQQTGAKVVDSLSELLAFL